MWARRKYLHTDIVDPAQITNSLTCLYHKSSGTDFVWLQSCILFTCEKLQITDNKNAWLASRVFHCASRFKESRDGIAWIADGRWWMGYLGIGAGQREHQERFVQFSFWPKSLSLMLTPLRLACQLALTTARFTVSFFSLSFSFSSSLSVSVYPSVRL